MDPKSFGINSIIFGVAAWGMILFVNLKLAAIFVVVPLLIILGVIFSIIGIVKGIRNKNNAALILAIIGFVISVFPFILGRFSLF